MQDSPPNTETDCVALVGMAGRYPGARDIEEFWRNLRDGVEAITRLGDDQLIAAGASAQDLQNPAYVKAAAKLDDIDLFDAAFFGFSAKDAAIMDPQHRLFLECAWHALEHAGWTPEQFRGRIGVFAGSGLNSYLIHNLLANRDLLDETGLFALKQTGNDKDVLATRVSYQLNLTGPSLAVQTACSTSLVAVHLACQSLLSRECDMALAGGVTIEVPHGRGYLYREGEILSRDGHCRPFDADSSGTIFASGMGIVVLRRLEDAIRDGDLIHAIIRGTAINNDGSRKAGFLAPSAIGQAEVIAEAMALAGIDADSISYVETHGTGTAVGDPIEIEALTRAFRAHTQRRGFCAIGSLKSNVGHLDAAAGVTGLIKTALALRHRQIPATINFKRPNPLIDFAGSPFFVADKLTAWEPGEGVRRAGVTSLGIGGTNAHVVIEEAPPTEASSPPRASELLTLSAKTPAALEAATRNFADYLEESAPHLGDVAFTCHLGRTALPYRRALACSDLHEAISVLRCVADPKVISGRASDSEPQIVFMFPGQGAQYAGMARALYDKEASFRATIDYCSEFLKPLIDLDLRNAIFDADGEGESAQELLAQTRITQPALFVIEYALARLWIELGLQPAAMIGHSVGEFAAACVAGVFTLDDAMRIVAERGRLIQQAPGGAMAVIGAPEAEVLPLLGAECSIASVNAADQCVAAGPSTAIAELEDKLTRNQLPHKRLRVSHAFHSAMMEPLIQPFAEFISGFQASPAKIRWVSSSTGEWITPGTAIPAEYWARQMRDPVRFYEAAAALLGNDSLETFLEVGPGRTLASLIAQHPKRTPSLQTIASLPGPQDHEAADITFMRALGNLWTRGCKVDWQRLHRGERRHRVELPLYPFERQRYWIEPDQRRAPLPPPAAEAIQAQDGIGFFHPVWKQAPLQTAQNQIDKAGPWLIFEDTTGLGAAAVAIIRERGGQAVTVRAAGAFAQISPNEFHVNPGSREDYARLVSALDADALMPRRIIHLWNVAELSPRLEDNGRIHDDAGWESASFWSLLFLAQALGAEANEIACRLAIVSNHLYSLEGETIEFPDRALLTGPCGVIPRELPHLDCQHIDVGIPPDGADHNDRKRFRRELARQLIEEISADAHDPVVAYRRNRRFVRSYQLLHEQPRPPIPLRQDGVYVITGGAGGIGLSLAGAIAESVRARLVFISRRGLPDRPAWPQLIANGDPIASKLGAIEAIESSGSEIMILKADVTDESGLREALGVVHQRFGAITGVIHAAGLIADAPILAKSAEEAAGVLAPKVRGTRALERVFVSEPLDFLFLCSSVSSVLTPAGQVDYAAANAFLDAFARARTQTAPYPVIAVQFPRWRDLGMAADPPSEFSSPGFSATVNGLSPDRVATEISLNVDRDWIVGEHRLLEGSGVFPGTGYVGMILAAAQQLSPGPFVIRDLEFERLLEVAPGTDRRVRTVLEREGAEYRFAASIESSNGWVECASARVTADGADEAPVLNLTAIQRRCCDREQTFAHRQNRQQERFFVFGPRWRTLERIAFGGDEALVTLELPPDFTSDLKDYPVHPALLDMATGAAMFLIADYERLGRAYVPVHYGRIRVLKALPARCLSYVRARSAAADSPVASFDVHILDMNGEPVIEIQEFMLRRMDDVRSAGSERSASRTDTQQTRGVGELSRPSVDSIVSSEGIAAFLQILRGSYVSNVVIFPSDFSAYSARAAARFPALHKRADNAQPAETMRDAIERTVAEWWTELLGAQSLTPQSDFFALGGQSLTAVRLFAKIRKTYDLQLSPATIFEAPTIEKLAQRIRGGVAPAAAVSSPSNAVPTPGSTASVLHNSDSRKAKGALIELRRGGPRNLFFVHDGEGEILLYLNLARRMPDNLAVFGIEPRRIAGVPMAHATIEDMASFYLEAVREKQPHGPYLLAGLCAGGTIAYEMASQLARAGERVDLLALLETALPKAKELPGRLAAQRRGRLKQAITDASKGQSAPFRRSLAVAYAITHKLTGALRWEISERGRQLWVSARVHLLREVLARGLAWPRFVPELSVTQIYYAAQARYTPKPLSIHSIVLVRARAGEGEDTPYREIYADETFGWKSVADRVTCLDVAGGHSTMLQEHFVDSVAKALLPYVRQSGAEILNRALEVV